MRIAVVGTGYVGLVAGACLAETGHQVVGADVDAEKIEMLGLGHPPIHEPGLRPLIAKNLSSGRLRFTTDVAGAVRESRVIFITVGTPPGEDGSADLSYVLQVARAVGRNLQDGQVVITKSTVPVGTAALVRREIEAHGSGRFHVCSNPEFLKEGTAVQDFLRPDRILCGIENDEPRPILEEIYEPFVRGGNPLIFMDIASAELAKYAANAMLASRISFMNQIAELCEAAGADVELVRRAIGSDPRIGRAFLHAGAGYGGSCFPKDVLALISTGEQLGVDLPILRAVHESNERQKRVLVRKAVERFGERLSAVRFAIWGLAFKPETDDIREAASLAVIEGLVARGAAVAVHDPVAMPCVRRWHLGDRLTYAMDEYAAAEGADALMILTEWQQYRRPDWDLLAGRLRSRIVFDGRNLFEPRALRERGFEYYPIGREQVGRRVEAPATQSL